MIVDFSDFSTSMRCRVAGPGRDSGQLVLLFHHATTHAIYTTTQHTQETGELTVQRVGCCCASGPSPFPCWRSPRHHASAPLWSSSTTSTFYKLYTHHTPHTHNHSIITSS